MDWTTSAMPTLQTNDCVQAAQPQAPQMNAQQNLMGQPIANQQQPMPSSSNNANKSTWALVCGIS